MKIFISWSGEKSCELAQTLKNWLPRFLQAIKPYYTPDDIEKGAKWQGSILENLKESSIGIICLTPDNLMKPWILFEAGALSNSLDNSRVCPLLFNVSKSTVSGPLSIFQLTEFKKDDFFRLLKSINNQLGDNKVFESDLEITFNMLYPKFEEEVNNILNKNFSNKSTTVERTEKEILEEILENTRRQTYQQQNQLPFQKLSKTDFFIIELMRYKFNKNLKNRDLTIDSLLNGLLNESELGKVFSKEELKEEVTQYLYENRYNLDN